MSLENPLWGAPRIHGELLKLGFEVAQSTVAKYMADRHDRPPGQSWWTFLRNHMREVAAMDLFVVPTLAFNLLYGFIIIRLGRRELVWIGVTNSPTADWIARQITEAFPWDSAPRYLIRDRDRVFGSVVTQRRLRGMGIRDKPIAPRSPWQNGYAERLIGSIRRECLGVNCYHQSVKTFEELWLAAILTSCRMELHTRGADRGRAPAPPIHGNPVLSHRPLAADRDTICVASRLALCWSTRSNPSRSSVERRPSVRRK